MSDIGKTLRAIQCALLVGLWCVSFSLKAVAQEIDLAYLQLSNRDDLPILSDEFCEQRNKFGLPRHLASQRFLWENDAGITDKDYTNGMKWEAFLHRDCVSPFSVFGEFIDDFHEVIPRSAASAPGTVVEYLGYGFGMNLYTPADITRKSPQRADRPYSGWAYLSLIQESSAYDSDNDFAKSESSRLELMVGVLGDWAQQDHVQTRFHEFIDGTTPEGWGHQHEGQLGFNIVYDLSRYKYGLSSHFQFAYGYGVSVGTVRSEVSGRAGIAFSPNENAWQYFQPRKIGPSGVVLPFMQPDSSDSNLVGEELRAESFVVFSIALEPRFKAYDFFLDASPPYGRADYSVNRYGYDVMVSIDWRVKRLPKFVFGIRDIQRSRDFDSVLARSHRFRQISWQRQLTFPTSNR